MCLKRFLRNVLELRLGWIKPRGAPLSNVCRIPPEFGSSQNVHQFLKLHRNAVWRNAVWRQFFSRSQPFATSHAKGAMSTMPTNAWLIVQGTHTCTDARIHDCARRFRDRHGGHDLHRETDTKCPRLK